MKCTVRFVCEGLFFWKPLESHEGYDGEVRILDEGVTQFW